VRLLSALHTDTATIRENTSDKTETVHDPHTDKTTATLTVSGVTGRPEWFQLTPCCPVHRWSHAALYPKQCKKVLAEGKPQRTQQAYIMQALLLQPARSDRATVIFILAFWCKGRGQPASNSIIIGPSGKLPHAFNREPHTHCT